VAEQRTLQMIAGGASLAEVLDDLCRTIDGEAQMLFPRFS